MNKDILFLCLILDCEQQHLNNMFYEDDKIKVETDGTVPVEQLKHIDTRMDTKCDQACIMCGPFSSSMWEKEYRSSKKDWSNTEMDFEIASLD